MPTGSSESLKYYLTECKMKSLKYAERPNI